jgi:twitching motility two-component system response regulator PilH
MPVRKILIVDDSPTERHVLNEMLVAAGYDVIASDSGDDAIRVAKRERPDAILMDIVMPGLNGFQATRQLTQDNSTRHIPVIICTTKNQETDRIWGMKQGAKDYVMKPIDEAELLQKIASQG